MIFYIITKHYVTNDNKPCDTYTYHSAFPTRKQAMAVADKLDKNARIYFYRVKRVLV